MTVPPFKPDINRPRIWSKQLGIIWKWDCEKLSTFDFLYLKHSHLKLDKLAAGLVNSSVFSLTTQLISCVRPLFMRPAVASDEDSRIKTMQLIGRMRELVYYLISWKFINNHQAVGLLRDNLKTWLQSTHQLGNCWIMVTSSCLYVATGPWNNQAL